MRLTISLFLLFFIGSSLRAETVAELLEAATVAIKEGQFKKALPLLDKAVALDPKEIRPLLVRGSLYGSLNRHKDAVADFTKVIDRAPETAQAYQQRGVSHFKLGHIADSITDFDKFIELAPEQKAGHWQRGISYYYAGRYEEGRRQFEGYQTVDQNDVENAVWRYLCMARKDGVAKAKKEMLKIGKDSRVPMTEIYELFSGRAKPADVLDAAKAGNPPAAKRNERLFYAHLYLGLYFETAGNKKKALEHLTIAADNHRIGNYMWDVARVHRDLLRKVGKD